MKTKSKILLSAIVTIVLCLSLIVGTTFALFTSESNVDITVKSGNVNVKATIANFATSSMDVAQENGAWANGGKASVTGNTVSLEKITPGDSVSFDINVDNSATNVSAKYRLTYTVENGYLLADGLDISISDLVDGTQKYKSYSSSWSDKVTETYTVTITLPNHTDSTIDNLYMDLSATISFKVEAVQANGVTDNGEAEFELLPDFTAAKEAAENNTLKKVSEATSINDTLLDDGYVVLTGDITTTANAIAEIYGDATIDFNGYTLTAGDSLHDVYGSLNVRNGQLNVERPGTKTAFWLNNNSSLTLDGVTLNAKNCFGIGLLGRNSSLVVKNSVLNVPDSIAVNTQADTVDHFGVKITLENTEINAVAGLQAEVPCEVSITGCTINGITQGIIARSGNITIKDSTIRNTLADNQDRISELTPCSDMDEFLTYFDNRSWSSGYAVPAAAITVGQQWMKIGNTTETLVNCPAIINLINTKVESSVDAFGKTCPTIYVLGQSGTDTEGNHYPAVITYDEQSKVGDIICGNKYVSINGATPDTLTVKS